MGEGKCMRYLAIGDGICAGNGAPFFSPGCIQRHARMSEEILRERVHVRIFARENYQSNDILELIDTPNVHQAIKQSQIIVLSAGQQDFIHAIEKFNENNNKDELNHAFNKCRRNVDDIIFKIRELKDEDRKKHMLIVFGLHNPYPDHRNAEKWVRRYNSHLECRGNIRCVHSVNLHNCLKDNLDAWCTRGYHYPNHIGHIEIAKQLHEVGYQPLLSDKKEDENK